MERVKNNHFYNYLLLRRLIVYLLVLKHLNRIKESYKSDNTTIGQFGRGTTTNYDTRLTLSSTGQRMAYILPGGGKYYFYIQPDGTFKNTNSENMMGSIAYLKPDNTRSLRFKDGAIHKFNSSGRLIEIEDKNNNKIIITRQAGGLITSIQEPAGRTLTFAYDGNGRITSVTDPLGRSVQYIYNSQGTLWKVTDFGGGVTTYTYDTQNRLQSITDARGIKFLQNIYDQYGRVSNQIMPDGGEFSLYYFSASTPVRVDQPVLLLTPNCGRTMTVFVREGEPAPAATCGTIYVNVPSSKAVPEDSTAQYTINQTIVTNPNGSSTTYRFDGQGYILSETDGIGGQISYERETGTHLLKTITDKLGRRTTFTHDGNGNITSITDPAGSVTRYEYDLTFNKPTKITDALGNVTAMSYDAKGNLVQILNPKSEITTISYNSYGKPTAITDALGNITTFTYDGYGNLIKTTDPLGNSAQMQYDFIGRLIEATDAKGKSTSYIYDLMNRITEITDALNGKTKFTYDQNGNLLTVTDAKAHTITYTYSVWDKVATMTDQLGRAETYSYDKMDNLVSVKDRKNQTTTYTYDFLSRLVNGQYADGSKINYSYDAGGRLTTVNDTASGMISLSYDNLDRLIQEITALGAISYAYNAIGSRTKAQIAGQEPVYYNYDVNSRLTGINQGTQTVLIDHDAIGRRTYMKLPNDIVATYNYDNANRLTDITYSFESQILKSLTYGYDKNGNRTSFTGHKTLLPEPKTAVYNQANQQTQVNGETLLYDENGNLIQKGDAIYTWNARNQLVSITSPSYNAAFKYDALGRRIEKTINEKTTNYLYDGWNIIQEIEDGTVTTNYLRSLNIDETLGIQKQDSIYYYLHDALGSTIALTDPSRNIATEYYYDPFGNTQTSNPNIYNPFQYTGRENDGNGYYSYRIRTKLGERFISQDPLGLIGGINFYSYVSNQPLRYRDPLGLWYIDINVSLGFWVGATGGLIIDTVTGDVYPYAGGGIVSPFGGVSVTGSSSNPSMGWSGGLQGTAGIAGQIGWSFGDSDWFGELGGGFPIGWSLTGYYVWSPIGNNPRKPIQPAKCH